MFLRGADHDSAGKCHAAPTCGTSQHDVCRVGLGWASGGQPTAAGCREDLAAVERAASAVGMPLSTFIRHAALGATTPLDVRAASARAEAIQIEARELIALLHGEVA